MDMTEGEGLPVKCASCGGKVLPPDRHCKICEDKKYTGIGGWLYLPALTLTLSVIFQFVGLFRVVNVFLTIEEEYKGFALFEAGGAIFLWLLAVYTTVLFFRKKRQLPNYYVVLVLLTTILYAIDCWIAAHFYGMGLEVEDIKVFVSCAGQIMIWIPYFRVSKRVKLTFVN
ncbi:DUF2569 domain-containing protein [Klebsiella spallanzanii]|uniref:DUF2569 domain-containing protein n=1 Tax=Klebsiella spallanzanii TaxID=2587528 RepID=A0A564J3A7_9ENTR|nr:DUF2569 domain-containing protein [Klebsiella spallanzanii]VUS51133.1 hypothetical protein SB6408_04308 [Klebsiella spallanzanii]